MSQMFLDAMTGAMAGLKSAGNIIQDGQMAQVDADWKNRKLAMEQELQEENLASSRQTRSIKDLALQEAKAEQPIKEQERKVRAVQAAVNLMGAEQKQAFYGTPEGKDYLNELQNIEVLTTKNKSSALSLEAKGLDVTTKNFDPDFEGEKIKLERKVEREKLINSLGSADWLRAKGLDPDTVKDALIQYDTDVRFGTQKVRNLQTGTTTGTTGGISKESMQINDDAIKLLNALKPEDGQALSPELDKLRTDLTQMVVTNIQSGYAMNAKLAGKTAEASTFYEGLQNQQAKINTDKADSKDAAKLALEGLGISGKKPSAAEVVPQPKAELIGDSIGRTAPSLALGNTEQIAKENSQVVTAVMGEANSVAAELGVKELPKAFIDKLSKADPRSLRNMSKAKLREMLKKDLTPYIEHFGAPLLDVEVLQGTPTNAMFSGGLRR